MKGDSTPKILSPEGLQAEEKIALRDLIADMKPDSLLAALWMIISDRLNTAHLPLNTH